MKNPKQHIQVKTKPFSNTFKWKLEQAPIEIVAPAKKIPGWKEVNGVAHQPVTDRTGIYKGEVADETSSITLVPYGFTKVRIVAFPVVK